MKWRFSPQLADQVENEITQRDQFNNDEVDLAETLVREAVQNSLDASVGEPMQVTVSFRWHELADGIDRTFFQGLFRGQMDHARAAGLDVDSLDFQNPEALIIEDFGTSGLSGSTTEKDEDNFSDFWRRHGKSHKTGKSRGRWGLGKLVYSTTSRAGVFFGLTVREHDTNQYLMGQTVLNLRRVDDTEYPPHAFFADLENEEDLYKRIPVPIKDTSVVGEFINNFSLARGDSPGLSVVIPFPNLSFNIKHMIGVAIENYFYPIITGQLVLVFGGLEINSANVRENAKLYAADRFSQIDTLFDFIEEVYKAEQSTLLQLKPSWVDDNKLDEDDFEPDDLETLRAKFSAGELVGIQLPVTIKCKDGTDENSYFSVYIKRPELLQKGLDLYVRGGLTLPAEEKFRDRRALAALIAEHSPVCSFLGDAENAAHTKWAANAQKLTQNYRNATYTKNLVGAIRKSLVNLYDLLAEVTEEKDEGALQDFFWFEEPDDGKSKKRKKKPKIPPSVPAIEPRRPIFKVAKIDGGFTVSNDAGLTDAKLPRELTVEAAYEVIKGNAFKKYSPHDFKVGKNGSINLSAGEGVKVVEARENRWTFEISKVPFTLKALGFDVTRDLKVKIS